MAAPVGGLQTPANGSWYGLGQPWRTALRAQLKLPTSLGKNDISCGYKGY
jgi:hypothetical protein